MRGLKLAVFAMCVGIAIATHAKDPEFLHTSSIAPATMCEVAIILADEEGGVYAQICKARNKDMMEVTVTLYKTTLTGEQVNEISDWVNELKPANQGSLYITDPKYKFSYDNNMLLVPGPGTIAK